MTGTLLVDLQMIGENIDFTFVLLILGLALDRIQLHENVYVLRDRHNISFRKSNGWLKAGQLRNSGRASGIPGSSPHPSPPVDNADEEKSGHCSSPGFPHSRSLRPWQQPAACAPSALLSTSQGWRRRIRFSRSAANPSIPA